MNPSHLSRVSLFGSRAENERRDSAGRANTTRSYVLREGRVTSAQRRALESLWQRYSVDDPQGELDFASVFGRRAPVVLDIGPGNGDVTLALAERHPENDYLAVEVYAPGVGNLLRRAERAGIGNLRIVRRDVVVVLEYNVSDETLDAALLFFPDPWPKRRHHKRRLIQAGFLERLARLLQRNGRIFIATDWEDYARHILECLREVTGLVNLAGDGGFAPRPRWRPVTRFEQAARRDGRRIYELVLARSH